MINCNPETVSTDYDTSDRLYFEPLTAEDVLEILRVEQQAGTLHGVIVQFGGQTPLKLADALENAGIPILGTTPDAIDLAEDRDRFQKLLVKLDLTQPKNGIAYSVEQSRTVASELGFPLVVRPSYVLGGRAMQIIHDEGMLQTYLLDTVPGLVTEDIKAKYPNDKTGQINTLLGKNPLLFDRYLTDAVEVDVDCLCDGEDVYISGIMEHIEEAGIHSGDSACSLPIHTLSDKIVAELEEQTAALARALKVGGLMNVQYAIKDEQVYVLEVNPRASRTVPFVAKTIGLPIAKIAARIMAGEKLNEAIAHYGERVDQKKMKHSPSRKPSSPSPASPASTSCSAPKCARPARSWASTATSPWPMPRPSSAPALTCRAPARCSSRSRTQTRPASCPPWTRCPSSASKSWPPPAPPTSSKTTASPPRKSTRSWKAAPTSKTPSATARSSSCSTPRTARRPRATPNRCAAPR